MTIVDWAHAVLPLTALGTGLLSGVEVLGPLDRSAGTER